MSELIINIESSNRVIVAFGGNIPFTGKGTVFEFNNFLSEFFSEYSRLFYVDNNRKCYHGGIQGISKDINTTVIYLKKKIEKYEDITFIGHSSGGYAAILFGSLLNVTRIIAFIPPTILKSKNLINEYRDLKPFINQTTMYHLYGDTRDDIYPYHHISHCDHIADASPNVIVNRLPEITIYKMRASGELLEIFNLILNKSDGI